MRIPLKKMVNDYFDGDRNAAAQSCGLDTSSQIYNLISKGAEVEMLQNGNFILLTKISKVFVVNQKETK